MALEGGQDKHLDTFAAHPKGHELKREGLSCAAGSQNRHVAVFVDLGIEDVDDDKRVVEFIGAEQNAIVITELIRGKGIAACRTQRQDIPFRAFIELFL